MKKGDAVSGDLGLAVVVASDEHFPGSPIVAVAGPSRQSVANDVRVHLGVSAKSNMWRTTSLLLDVPVEFTRPYRTAALRLTFRLEKRMLRSATLHLRTGTPASEVLYKIRLAQYIEAETNK